MKDFVNLPFYLNNELLFKKVIKKQYSPEIQLKLTQKYHKILKNYTKLNNYTKQRLLQTKISIDSNIGHHRQQNEDFHIAELINITLHGLPHNLLLFGVADGHGGNQCSKYISTNFSHVFQAKLRKTRNIQLALQDTISNINKSFSAQNEPSGSCLNINVLYIDLFREKYVLTTANVGDSRTVFIENNEVYSISKDHKPNTDQEHIVKNGGKVINNRLQGRLAVSRSLGDLYLQHQGLTATPDIYTTILSPSSKNQISVITSCDGIWDVIEPKEIPQIIKTSRFPAKSINQWALIKGSTDNVSTVLIHL